MLSESDQLVSQTLRHVASMPAASREIEGEKPGYLQRIITRSKQQLRSAEGQQIPTAVTEETVAGDSEEFPAMKTIYHFAENIFSSERASSDTLAFMDTIQQVRQGIEEATRLYVSPAVSSFLDAYPSKRTWITECLKEAKQALDDIGTDVESVSSREEDGSTVVSKLKFDLGLKIHKKLLKRQRQLNQCHIHLMGAIHVMQTVELCNKPGVIIQEPIYEAPVRPWVPRDERDTLRGPYSRQKHRLAYNYASISSLTLASENDQDDAETASVNSTPAELAGSTPSELSENPNAPQPLSPQTSHERLTDSPGLPRRPRASSDHTRRTAVSEVRSRASIDNIIGRHDSVFFTRSDIGIPMIARRFRATSIDIQSHNEKYKPRAQQSPTLKSQPSLLDGLADYSPSAMEVKWQSNEERAALPTPSESSNPASRSVATHHSIHAITSSIPQSMKEFGDNQITSKGLLSSCKDPELTRKDDTLETITSNNTGTTPGSYETCEERENSTGSSPYHPPLTTISYPSVCPLTPALSQDEGPVYRPSGQRPSQRKLKNTPNTPESRPEPTPKSPKTEVTFREDSQLPGESSNTKEPSAESMDPTPRFPPPPMIVIDDACQPILATETELPEDINDKDMTSSGSQQRLQREIETNSVPGNMELQYSVWPIEQPTRAVQPILTPKTFEGFDSSRGEPGPITVSAVNSQGIIAPNGALASRLDENRKDLVGKNPMSAQAKRRAAHARRMQLAFGDAANT